MLRTTAPYYRSSYVFVSRPGTPAITSFDDPTLRTAKIGVHLIGDDGFNIPPAHALASRGIVGNVRGYSLYGDYREVSPPSHLIEAISSGEIDVGIAWGPLGGYFALPADTALADHASSASNRWRRADDLCDCDGRAPRETKRFSDELDAVVVHKRPDINAILAAIPRAAHRSAPRRKGVRPVTSWHAGVTAVLLTALLGACEREDRPLRSEPLLNESREQIALSTNSPGPGTPIEYKTGTRGEYEKNAFHVSQGKKLYTWYNCSGCHANGGGGSGPALMDDVWIYGSSVENIAASIREGRPNGMPTFRGKIPEDQIWQIAAYVRALGGFVASDVASARHDQIRSHEGESRLPSPPDRTSSQPGLALPQ